MILKVTAITIGDETPSGPEVRDRACIRLSAFGDRITRPPAAEVTTVEVNEALGFACIYTTEAEAKKVNLGDEYRLERV